MNRPQDVNKIRVGGGFFKLNTCPLPPLKRDGGSDNIIVSKSTFTIMSLRKTSKNSPLLADLSMAMSLEAMAFCKGF